MWGVGPRSLTPQIRSPVFSCLLGQRIEVCTIRAVDQSVHQSPTHPAILNPGQRSVSVETDHACHHALVRHESLLLSVPASRASRLALTHEIVVTSTMGPYHPHPYQARRFSSLLLVTTACRTAKNYHPQWVFHARHGWSAMRRLCCNALMDVWDLVTEPWLGYASSQVIVVALLCGCCI
jgi:hypothetical protein